MAKASQVVLSENEFYLIKAPNGKVLEVKNFNTEDGAAIRLWDYAGHPWQQWKFVDAGEGRWRILYYKIADTQNNFFIIRRQYCFNRSVS